MSRCASCASRSTTWATRRATSRRCRAWATASSASWARRARASRDRVDAGPPRRGLWLLLAFAVVALAAGRRHLLVSERSPGGTRHVPSVRAQELYLEGMQRRSRRDIDATALALAKFEAAIKEDPEYAEAWAAYGARSRAQSCAS